MQNQLHQETIKEIAKVETYLSHLKAMKLFLEGGGVPVPKQKTKPAAEKPAARKRSPAGAFQATLLTLFSPQDILSNADVRDRLKAIKHPKVDNMHVRKTLTKMSKAGKLTLVKNGDKVAYKLP